MMLLSKTVAALERQSVFDAGVPFPLCGKPFQFLFKNSDVSFTAQLFRKVFVMHILPKSPTWVCSSPLPSAPPHNAQSVIMFYHIPSQHLRHGTQMGCFAGLPAPSRQSPVLMGLAQGLTTEALGKCWTKCLLLLPKHKACTNELIYSSCCPGLPKGQARIKCCYFFSPFPLVRLFFLRHNLKAGTYLWNGKWSQSHIYIAPKLFPRAVVLQVWSPNSSDSITWGLVTLANYWTPPQISWIGTVGVF